MSPQDIASLQKDHQRLEQENRLLRARVDWLIKRYFGGRKSEQIDPKQLELLLAGLSSAENEPIAIEKTTPEPELTAESPEREHPKPRRRRLPDHLEVQEVIIEPEEVKAEPQKWRCIGQEVTEELDLIPAKFIKRLYIRKKYVSKERPTEAPVIGPLPSRLIDKGIPGAGLLVHILLSKYADHLPLYRQQRIYQERYGVKLARQSMLGWMNQVAEWLKPIYNYMRGQLLTGGYLQVDETPIRYLEPDVGKKNGSRKGYLWVYGRPGGEVLFDWHTGRGLEYLQSFLNGYQGLVQSDGYGVYESFARKNATEVTLIGCWAHLRRKFVEALEESPKLDGWVVRQIAALYRHERYLREHRAGPALRQAYRQSHSAMTVQLLRKALPVLKRRALPRSKLGEAVGYALNQWPSLCRYLEHGQVEIDNNLIENAIRPTALGKKNWLFIGHPKAGWRSAVIYSIIESCRRHGHEPSEYLTDVLKRLPRHDDYRNRPTSAGQLEARSSHQGHHSVLIAKTSRTHQHTLSTRQFTDRSHSSASSLLSGRRYTRSDIPRVPRPFRAFARDWDSGG